MSPRRTARGSARSAPAVFLALAVLVAVGLSLLPASVAHAASLQVCTLQEDIVYQPPLTNTPQTLTYAVHGRLTACTDSAAPTGWYEESGTATGATCTSLLTSAGGTRTYHWSAGEHSTFAYTRVVNRLAGYIQVIATGSIQDGRYEGLPAISQGLGLQPDPLACAAGGVARLTAPGTLTIGV
ncbi:hypothetical protein ACIBQ6_36785 [Nonomuraea sp. NPDC049655]|uniref:hypothetical protein n=1 Tax=Nonomuraea sp. NPDC049655 TaxID=3364355 RepID=UPI003794A1FC